MKYILLLILVTSSLLVKGQGNDPKLQLYIDEGLELMQAKDYEAADQKFREVIDNLKPLPSRMAFFFGKNSYYLGKYKQSINWLNKYIQLKGADSQYYDAAKQFLQLAEEGYLASRSDELADISADLENDFDCYSDEFMVCPACKGSGVLIKQGAMENIYQTCPFSGGDGYLTCEEYNLYMKGKLEPKAN